MGAIKLNTNLADVGAGAIAGAAAGHFILSGEKKLTNGAMLGALVVVLSPTIKGFTDSFLAPKKAA